MARKSKKKEPRAPKLASLASAAILQAVDDLIKVERDAKRVVVMSEWVTHIPAKDYGRSNHITLAMNMQHKPKANCAVCFAGAVMTSVRQPSGLTIVTTSMFPEPLQTRLYALDNFRQGDVADGLSRWGYDDVFIDNHAPADFEAPEYYRNPARFKQAMRKLAKALAEKGF